MRRRRIEYTENKLIVVGEVLLGGYNRRHSFPGSTSNGFSGMAESDSPPAASIKDFFLLNCWGAYPQPATPKSQQASIPGRGGCTLPVILTMGNITFSFTLY